MNLTETHLTKRELELIVQALEHNAAFIETYFVGLEDRADEITG